MEWLNEPPTWNIQGDTLTVRAGPKTDFWRTTHYGFIRDNGHCYYQPVAGDFVAEVCFSGRYAALYDQAGLMLRADERTWLKCGIEYVNGMQHVSAVVTREFSDWSVIPLAHNPLAIWLRAARAGGRDILRTRWHDLHYVAPGLPDGRNSPSRPDVRRTGWRRFPGRVRGVYDQTK